MFIGIIILLVGLLTICGTSREGLTNNVTNNEPIVPTNCPKGCAPDINNTDKCTTRTSPNGQEYKDCPSSCWSNINIQDKAFCLYDSDCDNCDHVKIPMSSCLLTENEADCNQLDTCIWENNMCSDDPSKIPPKTKSDAEKKLEELLFLAFLEKKEKEQKDNLDISGQDLTKRQLKDGSVLFPGTTVIIFENGRALQKNKKSDSNSDIYTHAYYNKWGVPENPIDRRTNNLFSAYSKASSHFTGPVNPDDPASTTSPPSSSTDFGPVAFNANDYIKVEK